MTIPFLVPPLKLLMQFPLSYVTAAMESVFMVLEMGGTHKARMLLRHSALATPRKRTLVGRGRDNP
jgi:hypothetical protein